MKQALLPILLATTLSLHAQMQPPVAVAPTAPTAPTAPGFEALPKLDASAILQPQFLQGPNFSVRLPVPTSGGSNQYTIDSPYGVFTADGNYMLMRRIAEINGIAALIAMSQSDEFVQAAGQAATAPLAVAGDLITHPVSTISSVPRGIWGFLNTAGQAVKEAADGRQKDPNQGNAVSNMTGFAKTKRDIAMRLGVDPYCNNEIFQKELNKVAWPAFLGKFTVNLGLGAISGGVGTAISAVNMSNNLATALHDKSPTALRQMNLGILLNMGVPRADADAFLNNNALLPSAQSIIVDALAQLGNIPGQAEFIRRATTSHDEHDAFAFQQSAQLMADLNTSAPVASITHLGGLSVCQTNDGTVVVPIQWDYACWTPMTEQFVAALKTQKFPSPPTAYTVLLTGVASPMAAQALAGSGVNLIPKGLPGPLL